jgi:hypothetical protein
MSFVKLGSLGQIGVTPKVVRHLEFSFIQYPIPRPPKHRELLSRCHLGNFDSPYHSILLTHKTPTLRGEKNEICVIDIYVYICLYRLKIINDIYLYNIADMLYAYICRGA